MVIVDKELLKIWEGIRSRKWPAEIQSRIKRLLRIIYAAKSIRDLKNLPSLRLHKLKGDREGQYSVSINMQYRICFIWKDGAVNVEITNHYK